MNKLIVCESCEAEYKIYHDMNDLYYIVLHCTFCGANLSKELEDPRYNEPEPEQGGNQNFYNEYEPEKPVITEDIDRKIDARVIQLEQRGVKDFETDSLFNKLNCVVL